MRQWLSVGDVTAEPAASRVPCGPEKMETEGWVGEQWACQRLSMRSIEHSFRIWTSAAKKQAFLCDAIILLGPKTSSLPVTSMNMCYKKYISQEFGIKINSVPHFSLFNSTCGHTAGSIWRLVPCLEQFLLQIFEQQAHTHTLISHRGHGAEGQHKLSSRQVKHVAVGGKLIMILKKEKLVQVISESGGWCRENEANRIVLVTKMTNVFPKAIRPSDSFHYHLEKWHKHISALHSWPKQEHRELLIFSLFTAKMLTKSSNCCPD